MREAYIDKDGNAKWREKESMGKHPLDDATGYLQGIEIYQGYAQTNPHNCAVKERTGDGVPVGPCCFYLDNGATCPRHGKVKEDNTQ